MWNTDISEMIEKPKHSSIDLDIMGYPAYPRKAHKCDTRSTGVHPVFSAWQMVARVHTVSLLKEQ